MRICFFVMMALSLFCQLGCGPSKGSTVLPKAEEYNPASDPTDPSNAPK